MTREGTGIALMPAGMPPGQLSAGIPAGVKTEAENPLCYAWLAPELRRKSVQLFIDLRTGVYRTGGHIRTA